MSTLQEIGDEYFNGVHEKFLKGFTETTPKGNIIHGYICTKPNKYLGSCLITNVNDEPVHQFVQSMPKIHYFNDPRDILPHPRTLVREKLDGTCLILYPLKNSDGEVIEIVPKTRGRAVADKHFLSLYNKVDKKPILDYYKEHEGILIFELCGVLNQHDITHYPIGLDIKLICIVEDNKFSIGSMEAYHYGFTQPDVMFILNNNGVHWMVQPVESNRYSCYLKSEAMTFDTNYDAVEYIKKSLEKLNSDFVEYNNRQAVEGVVITTTNVNNELKFIKCKPADIELKHRSESGIPRSSIRKEVFKYFDEYGAEVKDIYLEDKNHHTEYLHRQLLEEYPQEYINKSKNKIERIFMQVWEAKEVPVSIHNICDKLITENPGKDIKDLMRIFAVEYPMKKKDAHTIYTTLEYKLKKQN